jgi:hypothetical protein
MEHLRAGLLVEIVGDGDVKSQSPSANTLVNKNSIVRITGENQVDTTVHYGID